MFFLIPVGVALLVFGGLGVAGIGPLVEGRRSGTLRRLGPWLAIDLGVGTIAIAVLTTALAFGVLEDDGQTPERASGAQLSQAERERLESAPAVVRLTADDDHEGPFPSSPPVIDELSGGTVLRIHVEGFEPGSEAVVSQCARGGGGPACGNAFPVQIRRDGTALFQYEIHDVFRSRTRGTVECGLDGSLCSLVVETRDPSRSASIETVFGGSAPGRGEVVVNPRTELTEGETVRVSVRGFPPRSPMSVVLCSAPDAAGSARCGAPGPVAALLTDQAGRGAADLEVRAGPVGSEAAPCDRTHPCGVAVLSDSVTVGAPVVEIGFAPPPGAAYDPTRLAVGLAVAALLIVTAVLLIRGTDWSPIGEAQAPQIDQAEYPDLDAIVEALPEDPELVVD